MFTAIILFVFLKRPNNQWLQVVFVPCIPDDKFFASALLYSNALTLLSQI